MDNNLKKMEDDLKKKWKTTSKRIEDNLKNGSRPKKNTIKKNQP